MSYAINNLPSCITIGRETETAVTEIRIDCAEWLDRWSNMDVSVIVRTGRGAIYIPANLTMEGKTLVWCVDDVDTSILNKSTMEITGIAPDRHKLSEKVDILVDERLAGTTGETPDPMKPWVDRVIEAANTVGDARDDAVSAKDEAYDSANVAYKAAFDARESEKNAHASEQEAAQSANIAKDAEENTRATLVTVNGLAEYAKSSAEMAKESEEKSLQNANNAGTYATSAKESERIARESGETAKASAQSAQTSAGSATESANQAKRSEEAAKGYADNTGEYARIATEKAQKATEQANSAGVSATSAEESANRASASEQNAATSAQEAKSSADSTKGYSESANEAAVNASDSAREAQVSAENAAASANNAEASKASAQVSAENARVSSQNAEDALQELRDKIASGEFKGEPGEPGKDAVVDATLTKEGQAADAKVTGEALSGKLTEPSTGLAVGKYFRIAAIDESGHAVLEAVDLPSAPVQDVQVDGTSIVEDGVANVPIANARDVIGLVKVGSGVNGIGVTANGLLALESASYTYIKNRQYANPITPSNLDYAVKAAMCDGKGAAWSEAEQAAARERMGIDKFEKIAIITLEEDSTPIIDLGAEYEKLFILFEIPAGDTCIGGNYIRNQNGANVGFFPTNSIFTNLGRTATAIISRYGDYWTCDSNYGGNNSAMQLGSNRSANKNNDDIITQLNFSNPIRTSSKISVYGVRVS